jgi:hypothetical protein
MGGAQWCVWGHSLREEVESVSAKFDIFRRLPDGNPMWIKAVESLEEARRQLIQMSEKDPGEYFIFNTLNGQTLTG